MSEKMNCARDPRVGLQLTRYHSWPRTREQSVGEHSAQVMRILLTVWPEAPRELLVHALFHDIGEMAGDVQYPYKQKVDGLKRAMDTAEHLVYVGMHREFDLPLHEGLDPFHSAIFKLCECIEMWEWGLHEQNLGNRYAQMVSARMLLEASRWQRVITDSIENPRQSSIWCDVEPRVKRYIEKRAEWEK